MLSSASKAEASSAVIGSLGVGVTHAEQHLRDAAEVVGGFSQFSSKTAERCKCASVLIRQRLRFAKVDLPQSGKKAR